MRTATMLLALVVPFAAARPIFADALAPGPCSTRPRPPRRRTCCRRRCSRGSRRASSGTRSPRGRPSRLGRRLRRRDEGERDPVRRQRSRHHRRPRHGPAATGLLRAALPDRSSGPEGRREGGLERVLPTLARREHARRPQHGLGRPEGEEREAVLESHLSSRRASRRRGGRRRTRSGWRSRPTRWSPRGRLERDRVARLALPRSGEAGPVLDLRAGAPSRPPGLAANRSDGFLGSDLSQDDGAFFDGKPEDFSWKLVGARDAFVSPIRQASRARWSGGGVRRRLRGRVARRSEVVGFQDPQWTGIAWAPLAPVLRQAEVWIVEAKPRDPYYLFERIELGIDQETFQGAVSRKFDAQGALLRSLQFLVAAPRRWRRVARSCCCPGRRWATFSPRI